ncbi:hypothetical protein PTSG_04673 [Salpingoeca rosetta]|uniref:Dynein axonemal intermediate chain 4 n=1 Tax=Salpingoeca rosetta (strain ATCC 50818 / BSB-021) TaxID=946362 RepID=F2U836_SALR5|nr:uncharacterized protein PTSG_04673 [Salpingoeca rosetta]EGD72941.1 hypothetical protein PTSG_04673 [Salpingoeca rosetta]|eukprot:XP_004994763.1 hypothetical protein PTSG_04673 [Salpingoeca rosetta]
MHPHSSNGSSASSRNTSAFGRKGSRGYSRGTSSNNTRKDKHALQYLDESGHDVTPRSLLEPHRRKTIEDVRVERTNFMDTMAMPKEMSWGSRMMSSAEGSMAMSLPHFSYMGASTRSTTSDSSQRRESAFDVDEIDDTIIQPADVAMPKEEEEELTDADLNKMVYIKLEETDTISLLDVPPTWIPDDDEAVHEEIKKENDAYEALLEKKQTIPDDFTDRFTQTTVFLQKEQAMQTAPRSVASADCQVSIADIHDCFDALTKLRSKVRGKNSFANMASKVIAREKGPVIALQDPRTLLKQHHIPLGFGVSEVVEEEEETVAAPEEQWEKAKESVSVKRHLQLLERLIEHDTFAPQQALIKQDDVFGLTDDPSSRSPLRHAWTYACDTTKNMVVTCCAWNKANPDIVAVGYGRTALPSPDEPGMLCCWSIKQPQYPHRIYTTPSTVMAVDFSREHPQMLAVGMASGTIAIYDVYKDQPEPLLDTTPNDTASKHTHAVWDIQFVSLVGKQGADDREEMLVSGSSDGLVLQWHLHKGLDSSALVKVKRVASQSKAHHGNSKTAFIARQAGVMSMAFSPTDASLYLVGTEDGNIHKCSTSYSDTYLESFFGHTASVYRLQYSPVDTTRLLSCSADWSLKLWDGDSGNVVQTLQCTTSAVRDACWSHHRRDVLASISDDKLFLWNLADLEQDPVFSCQPHKGAQLSCVLFNPQREYLVVGDTAGNLHVYSIHLKTQKQAEEAAAQENSNNANDTEEQQQQQSSSGSGSDVTSTRPTTSATTATAATDNRDKAPSPTASMQADPDEGDGRVSTRATTAASATRATTAASSTKAPLPTVRTSRPSESS